MNPNDYISEEVFLADMKAREAETAAAAARAAQELRTKDIPANLGTTAGPRGKDLIALRQMNEQLGAMLVGPKEEQDWTAARRHIRLLISRFEMDTRAVAAAGALGMESEDV